MDLATAGRWIIFAGLGLAALGLIIWALSRTGLPLGSLPGDIRIEREGFSFYFPVTTTILISAVLTVLMNLAIRLFGK